MKTFKEIKKKLGISQKEVAEYFDMSYSSYANSTAKPRYENALCKFYDKVMEVESEEKLNMFKKF